MLRLHEFRHHRPHSLREALELLAAHEGEVMPVAGGTDLVPNMKHRLFLPGHVVALKGVPELRGITVQHGELVIGATETLSDVACNALVRQNAPALARAAGLIAGPQLRNMGTIGGNVCLDTRCTYYNQTLFWRQALGFCLKKDGDVCHVTRVGKKCVAAHSADTPPVLMALGASADLVSPNGSERTIRLRDFFLADGVWNSVRRPDEILVRVRIPVPPAGARAAYQKLRQRNAIDFPLLSIAAAARFSTGDTVESIEIVVSALGARPRVLTGLDSIAVGRQLADPVIDALAERAFQQCHPLENMIVDADWRRAMVRVYAKRALRDLRPSE
jgi:4-hydroxybenzoyl-CoA reductase subunit beta